MSAFELRMLPLSELTPAAYHARRPLTLPARRALRGSLMAYGVVEPVVWNETTGRLVGGNARRDLLTELGRTEVPVSVVRLSEAHEKALHLVLNNTKAQGRYDTTKLGALLADLAGRPEFAFTGFDHSALAAFHLKPAESGTPESPSRRVEITFVASEAMFAKIAPALDQFIGEHSLIAHVRHSA